MLLREIYFASYLILVYLQLNKTRKRSFSKCANFLCFITGIITIEPMLDNIGHFY